MLPLTPRQSTNELDSFPLQMILDGGISLLSLSPSLFVIIREKNGIIFFSSLFTGPCCCCNALEAKYPNRAVK